MGKYVLVVPSSAKAGQDDEYNQWYDGIHIHDLLALPGVKNGRRYIASPISPMPPPADYLAIYEIETDDIGAVFAELNERAMAGVMQLSDALDMESARMWVYEQTLEEHSS